MSGFLSEEVKALLVRKFVSLIQKRRRIVRLYTG